MGILSGPPGHPSHPPLTDASIGAYTVAAALAVIGLLGWIESQAAVGMWLALLVGLALALPTAGTGLLDWLSIPPGTPTKKTATWHLSAMLAATAVFVVAAVLGYSGFDEGAFGTSSAVMTLVGFGVLTIGGWLGGTIVYVHGHRVLGQSEIPAAEAASVTPDPQVR